MKRLISIALVALGTGVSLFAANPETQMSIQSPKRGAIPTPREVLAAAMSYVPTIGAPPNYIIVPGQLSMWGNDVHGDCVTAEEAFAKACNNPEIFIPERDVIAWATRHGVLEGAYLVPVMTSMQNDGFAEGSYVYDDGPHFSVDFTNSSALQSAIATGPVKLGIAADQIETAYFTTGGVSGWFATGFHADYNEDHCVALCGYGSISWLAQQLHVAVPAGIDGTKPGYAMYTWDSIGIIDEPSMIAITGEAWVRQPTTVIAGGGLVAYYPFSGNTLDRSGHGLNAVNHGASLTSDRFGNPNSAYHFNGSSYITIPGTSAFNGMSSFTLSAWIKPDTTSQGVILSKVSPNRDFVLDAVAGDSGYLNAQFAHGATYYHGWATSPKVPTTSWTHVAAVWNGASWQLFINGALAGQASTGGQSPLWTGTDMEIGALLSGGLLGFTGSIDEVRIYNTALSASEISRVMGQNLVAYYPFNGSTNDLSGHSLNGVNQGATLTSDRSGNSNAAYHFNGSSSINIPATAAFNGMSSFTLAAWIKPDNTNQGVIVSKVSPNRDFVLDVVPGDSGYLNAQFAHNATYFHGWATSPKVPTNSWTHVASVWDGASWQLFINGSLAGQASTGGQSPLWTGTDMEIGALLSGGLLGFTGSIDEVQVYNTSLTQEEITELMWQ